MPLLEHLVRVGRRAYEREMSPTDLRPRHVIALRLLAEHGPRTQQGLAEALSLDPSNVVGLLNDLEERALIVRCREPTDRRRHIVSLTDGGEKEVELSNERGAIVEDSLLMALNPEERATLIDLLGRVVGTPTCECPEEYRDA